MKAPESRRVYHQPDMQTGPFDLAQVRMDNALRLFDEFVRQTARHADAAMLRGLDRRFAEHVQIQPSYWSQLKSRSRQIGERLARQFEQLCGKPRGWLDVPHGSDEVAQSTPGAVDDVLPRDEDERFIVGLVLTFYRRHPQRAKVRLLDLLGEVLIPAGSAAASAPPPPAPSSNRASPPGQSLGSSDDGSTLWRQTSQGIAPLKRRK